MKDIKWCAIQPLTGGMYLGTEQAVGHKAEFILSYPGVGDPKVDKNGTVISGGNEYHLMKYLEKVGRRPEYKVFNRTMFQNDHDMSPEIMPCRWTLNADKPLDYNNMDLCVAVPVCSGLSTATIGDKETLQARNCNMLWIAEYALKTIQPKIYIFENAPTFLSARADYVREGMEKLAKETGYSLIYYRTNTLLHHNCQSRKRTFIIFMKKDFAPALKYEAVTKSIAEYFAEIPADATQNEPYDFAQVNYLNKYVIEYFHDHAEDIIKEYNLEPNGNHYTGDLRWRNYFNNVFKFLLGHRDTLFPKIEEYVNNREDATDKQKAGVKRFFAHINDKLAQNKGFFHAFPFLPIDTIPAIMYKTVQACLHPFKGDHLLSVRECLHLMGHPMDFELQGTTAMTEFHKIGQNVPVKTAYWIVSEALRAFDYENDLDEKKPLRVFDNIKQKEITDQFVKEVA